MDGKLVREVVGHDREDAEKRLGRVRLEIVEHGYTPPQHKRFSAYADEWHASLRRRRTTTDSYATTLDYAKRSFGGKYVSKIGVADVRGMLEIIERENRRRTVRGASGADRPSSVSPTTLAKHLRQLSVCLEAAVGEGLLAVNPVKELPRSLRLQPRRRLPADFSDAELLRLWSELVEQPLYRMLCKLATTTGLRFGELAGLHWSDVHLFDGELHIRRQFTHGELVERPKGVEPRIVDLVPAARHLFDAWWSATGAAERVFTPETGGYLDDSRTRKVLYAAMRRAGIPRTGELGGTRDFQSFRHTFVRVALENGAQLEWVQRQLGHSTVSVTRDTYGHWSRSAEKREAERPAGAFAV